MLYQVLTTMNLYLGKEVRECHSSACFTACEPQWPILNGASGMDPAAVANSGVFRGPERRTPRDGPAPPQLGPLPFQNAARLMETAIDKLQIFFAPSTRHFDFQIGQTRTVVKVNRREFWF
jgi:hypothetical protein